MKHDGYFYLNVAEGGTAGPGTSHFVISARSRHADGPWEYSPYNPIVHTPSRDDRWLSLGHGRLIDTPGGKWYITVHSYENGYRSLGRQLMLLPIEWTSDGWFRQVKGVTAASAILCQFLIRASFRFSIPPMTSRQANLGFNGLSGKTSIQRDLKQERTFFRLLRAGNLSKTHQPSPQRLAAIPIQWKPTSRSSRDVRQGCCSFTTQGMPPASC